MKTTLFIIPLVSGLAFGQTLKREQPAIPPQQLDAAIKTLKNEPARAEKKTRSTSLPLAKDWNPPPVIVPETAKQAVSISDKWTASKSEPLMGKDGRVVFTYGAGLPVVTCAVLRVCVVEFQSGEHFSGDLEIGDPVRWDVRAAFVGKEPTIIPLLVIKPKAAEVIDTNLVVTTDRRAYYIRLVSDPVKYVARASFEYPDESGEEWRKQIAVQAATAKKEEPTLPPQPVAEDIENWNFNYSITGKDKDLRPLRVIDNSKGKTIIQMNPSVQYREAPVLMIIDANGKESQVNYRVKGDQYIVDRLFDRAVLVVGIGKHAQRIEITRLKTNG